MMLMVVVLLRRIPHSSDASSPGRRGLLLATVVIVVRIRRVIRSSGVCRIVASVRVHVYVTRSGGKVRITLNALPPVLMVLVSAAAVRNRRKR